MIYLKGNEYNELLPSRPECSHKGTFGTLGVVGGSVCYQGAVYFAVTAALRTGVGIAVALIPDVIYDAFAAKVSGAVIEPLKSIDGAICDGNIKEKMISRKVNAVLCGCGLGLNDTTLETVKSVLSLDIPAVIDGDGLSAASLDLSCFDRQKPTVLTPHIGEFSRLCGKTIDEIKSNRLDILKEFSVKYNCITVLKDSFTVISDEVGTLYCLDNPCSALSKGGSGDVLAGMTASLIAQGVTPIDSAISAVTLHNACGRLCAENIGERFCQPDDFIRMISTLKV